jgi:hypothetical protein
MSGALGPSGFLVAGCLAFANVFVPLGILWLILRRRRSFNMWTLMVLPVMAAVPLVVYQTVLPWLSAGAWPLLATENRVFLTGTFAGIPVVCFLGVMGASLVRRRWERVAGLLGLSLIATLVVAGGWIGIDRRSMAVNLEHYVWEGWWLVFLVGAYLAVVFLGFGVCFYGVYRWVRRRGARASA